MEYVCQHIAVVQARHQLLRLKNLSIWNLGKLEFSSSKASYRVSRGWRKFHDTWEFYTHPHIFFYWRKSSSTFCLQHRMHFHKDLRLAFPSDDGRQLRISRCLGLMIERVSKEATGSTLYIELSTHLVVMRWQTVLSRLMLSLAKLSQAYKYEPLPTCEMCQFFVRSDWQFLWICDYLNGILLSPLMKRTASHI